MKLLKVMTWYREKTCGNKQVGHYDEQPSQ